MVSRFAARSLALPVAVAVLGLFACSAGAHGYWTSAPAKAGAAHVTVSSGPLSATIVPGTHHPKVNTNWPLTVTATLKGKPAHATAFYLFMLGPTVVSTQYPYSKNPYHFTGSYHDTFVWPADSLGQPLTLRVVVSAGGRKVNLDWNITSVK